MDDSSTAFGSLAGVTIIEMAGLGPAPFAAMLLADHGARVVRIDRLGGENALGIAPERDPLNRGRQSIALDLKKPEGIEIALSLIEKADGLIEGFRPGVMERLGLGPDKALSRNPRLVYARMTGWGQDGPLAERAGHDITYAALSGALGSIGSRERPAIPLNLVADFGGGALYCAFGLIAGILSARSTGRGQVIDAAMVDGVAHMMTMIHGMAQAGLWRDARGENLLDGGTPWYDVYECACGGFMAVGALEPKFYALLLQGLGLDPANLPARADIDSWPVLRAVFTERFKQKTRVQWTEIFENSDACVAPVLGLGESVRHPHAAMRKTFITSSAGSMPAPAPRFSATPGAIAKPPGKPGAGTDTVLAALGYDQSRIDKLRASAVID